jgi:ABC-type transport system involved in Fe-S cluster assembly fused permease/ATPase subunit
MEKIYILYIVITLHFIFDWVLQPRAVAKSKKKDINSLANHMFFQILPFSIIMFIILVLFGYDFYPTLILVMVNFVSHFFLDALLPSGKNEREMINWTAIDQILHINILIFLIHL